MGEIIVKIQLDLSDAVKEFMASIMGCGTKYAPTCTERVEEPEAPEERHKPAPEPEAPTPEPVAAAPVSSDVSREKIRNLVKAALIAEKASPVEAGGVKAILMKYGATNVTEVKEEDFVNLAAELTEYKNNLPAF